MTESRPPFPPFTLETAQQKVQAAEDAWNTRDPERVSLAYTVDSQWRNRDQHVVGREQIVAFLTRKWQRELDYVLRKSLWGFRDNRMAVRFQYECHDADGQWYRSYGNELWEFTPEGLMARREASINDVQDRRVGAPLLRSASRIGVRARHPAVVRPPWRLCGVGLRPTHLGSIAWVTTVPRDLAEISRRRHEYVRPARRYLLRRGTVGRRRR